MISVIVATLNRPDDLERLLSSLLRQIQAPGELIVVDQSDDEGTRQLAESFRGRLQSRGTELSYLHQADKSLVKARNRGLEHSKGEILCFLDDDTELEDGYLAAVQAYFGLHAEIAGLSGNVLVQEMPGGLAGRLRRMLSKFFLLNRFDGTMTSSGFGCPVFERRIHAPIQVELLPGCDMNYARWAIGADRFDEWFSGYSYREDVDFSFRISRKAPLVMIPDAKLRHFYSPANRAPQVEEKIMEFRNNHYLFRKHKNLRWYSPLLFAHSVLGVLVFASMEWAARRNRQKWGALTSDLRALWTLLRERRPPWTQLREK